MMEFIPTNDVFKRLLLLLRLRDKDEIVALFKTQGLDVTKSQIKAWQTMTGEQHPGYRAMPKEILVKFISALHDARLVLDE
jgi:uncharacterized protein YehS (DUF1456 family)